MNKKIKSIILILLIIIVLISIFVIKEINKEKIELIQLSSQTNDRMMGYIIRTNNGKTIVIDGGMNTDAENLKKYIKQYNNRIDYWFITHPHRDHAGAFIDIIENNDDININKVYYCANPLEWYQKYSADRVIEIEKFYQAIENQKINEIKSEPQIGDKITIDNIQIEILGINNPEITTNPINNLSMVFKLYVNNKSILFLGDTGEESSKKLIDKYGRKLKSDIVQMAHHGQQGATEELYKLVKPKICLWPTPEWLWSNDSGEGYNSGPWKTLETIKWTEDLKVEKNYVAKDGDITIEVK